MEEMKVMPKNESVLKEEAALNNNLDAATLQMNSEIAKEHKKPNPDNQPHTHKKTNTKLN